MQWRMSEKLQKEVDPYGTARMSRRRACFIRSQNILASHRRSVPGCSGTPRRCRRVTLVQGAARAGHSPTAVAWRQAGQICWHVTVANPPDSTHEHSVEHPYASELHRQAQFGLFVQASGTSGHDTSPPKCSDWFR